MSQQDVLDFVNTHTRTNDHDASIAAAESTAPAMSVSMTKVLHWIARGRRYHIGLTDYEGGQILTSPDGKTMGETFRRRRIDLCQRGLVVKSEHKRKNDRGNAMTVWVVA